MHFASDLLASRALQTLAGMVTLCNFSDEEMKAAIKFPDAIKFRRPHPVFLGTGLLFSNRLYRRPAAGPEAAGEHFSQPCLFLSFLFSLLAPSGLGFLSTEVVVWPLGFSGIYKLAGY